jgi:hypothetical protein
VADWYYAKNRQQLGPVDDGAIRQLAQSGQLASSDLVWRDGMAQWTAAAQVPELAAMFAPAAPQPQAPVTPAQYPNPYQPQSPQYGQPPYPGQPLAYNTPPPAVKTWLVESILCLFCCWPLAIAAIIFAAQVSGKLASGDYIGAQQASRTAKICVIISFCIGGVFLAFYVLMMIIGVASSGMSGR